MIYSNICELIGSTPLLRLSNFGKDLSAEIIAKLECFNPAGSAKDRIAKNIIESAERDGKLKKGSVIIEPTSGNTGIGLAAVAASKGYKVILTMPESMSQERRKLLAAFGAELVLTEGKKGMNGAIEKAKEIAESTPNAFLAGQFYNPSNPEAHYLTTGPEIWNDTNGEVDIFVSGVGTGGTISGVGKYLKEKNPNIKIIAVEPSDSPVLSGGSAGPHPLQGIGAGFIPDTLDTDIFDEVICVSGLQAFSACKQLVRTEGILAGISSGAALTAASVVARREENNGKKIVVLLPDTGERYLSTNIYE